jgi:hypothetical protein
MAAATHGKKAVSALLHKLVIWNVDLKYYLFSVVGVLALGLMVALIWSRLPNEHANEWQEILPLFMNLVIAGPLAEELGWRGFALPALLKKWNPLLASLFLGVVRAVWYLPFFLLPGMPQSRMAIPVFLLAAIAISIISTWLYTNTSGSVFLPILFNLCINIALIIFGAPSYAITTSIFVVAIVLVLSSLPEWLNRQLEPTLY